MIYIHYGYRPGEKIVQKGYFICPLCNRKRQYHRVKVQKKAFISFLTLFPIGDIGEYVQCQSCLKPFSTNVLDASAQLQIAIDDSPLTPTNIMDAWQQAYTALDCEAIASGKSDTVEVVSPILLTMAANLQQVGVSFRLQDFENARRCLVNIVGCALEWERIIIRGELDIKKEMPRQHHQIMEYMNAAYVFLSRLP